MIYLLKITVERGINVRIFTLTLNPAFDVHCQAEGFKPYSETIVEVISREAGGKGVNISRALKANGVNNTAVVVLGNENGEEFSRMLAVDGVTVYPITVSGRVRENITLHEQKNPETRISFGGSSVDKSIFSEVAEALGEPSEDMIITLTGSIPSGISAKELLEMLRAYRAAGARVVIDSRSVALDEILAFKPWLIKPNKDEIEKYVGKTVKSPEDAACIGRELHKSGVENVLISLGGEGAVLTSEAGCFHACPQSVAVRSTVGAGDSTVAGFIDAYTKNIDTHGCLCRAVAFGTAACLREGTRPPLKEDIEWVLERAFVKEL